MWFLIALALAIGIRAWLYYPGEQGDTVRYLAQAGSLYRGEGFNWKGESCTHLPPGYPVFIAGLWMLQHSTGIVRTVQQVLSLVSCVVVYDALRRYKPLAGLIGLYLMALAPFVAHRAAYLMSETLTVFLMSIFVWLLAQVDRRRVSPALFAAVGAVAVALLLTAPGTLFLAFTGTVAVALLCIRRPSRLAWLAAGAFAVMLPWQLHCRATTGTVVPTVYEFDRLSSYSISPGYKNWVKTWLLHPDESRAAFYWRQDMGWLDKIPQRAFDDEAESVRLRCLCSQFVSGEIAIEDFDRQFQQSANVRISRSPWQCYVWLPLARGALVWATPDTPRREWRDVVGGPIRPEYFGRLDTKTGILTTFVLTMHGLTLFAFAYGCVRAVHSRRLIPIAIVAGVAAYTVAGALVAGHEVRRNIAFYPALFVLLGTSVIHRRDEEIRDDVTDRH